MRAFKTQIKLDCVEKGKKGLDSGRRREAMATRDGVGRAPGAAAALL